MVSSSITHDTPNLSESMLRRLAKEHESMQQNKEGEGKDEDGRVKKPWASAKQQKHHVEDDDDNGDSVYPCLYGEEDEELRRMRSKLELIPSPPPEYPAVMANGLTVMLPTTTKSPSDHGRTRSKRSQRRQKQQQDYYREKKRPTGDDDVDADFEGKIGHFRLVGEWATSLVLDSCLLMFEFVINVWLALILKDQGRIGQYQAVVVLFCVPSCVNAALWVKLYRSYRNIGFLFMLAVAFFGFPSPLLVYVWHLYRSAFCKQCESQKSRILANTFRIVQAFTCSLPLVLLNLYTVLSILKIEGKDALDISQLTRHLGEGINVFFLGAQTAMFNLQNYYRTFLNIHGVAAILSFVNILRAASVFNERQTFTLLFVMVGYPFLLFTTLSRILALGVIACFMDFWWTVVLVTGLVLTNLSLYIVCRKRASPFSSSSASSCSSTSSSGDSSEFPSTTHLMRTMTTTTTAIRGDIEEQMELRSKLFEQQSDVSINSSGSSSAGCSSSGGSGGDSKSCCGGGRRKADEQMKKKSLSWQVVVVREEEPSIWDYMPKLFLMSICSVVIPVGYTNDYRSHHPRIKGGLFILMNYLFNMICIGLALGFTIINDVPNTFHGVALPQPSLKVEVPGSKVIVQAGGLDVALNLPNTQIDLGSMPTFSATLNTDSTDHLHAIIIPVILCLVTAPFVVMRAAMMELDCFLARKKQLRGVGGAAAGAESDEVDGLMHTKKTTIKTNVKSPGAPLGEAIRQNAENKELKARLYLTVCCSMCGMCVFTVLMVLTGVFLAISLH